MTHQKKCKVYILDSSALIGGVIPTDLKQYSYISPLVELETTKNMLIKIRLQSAKSEQKLSIRTPSRESVDVVTREAQRLGENLSNADVETIALALDMKEKKYTPVLISDDYSVENLCELLDISYTSMITMGIKKFYQWFYFCPGCGKTNDKDGLCRICGTPLKRKPKHIQKTQHRTS
jgi:UPF0271 protein